MSKAIQHPELKELMPLEYMRGGHGTIILRLIVHDDKKPLKAIGSAFMAGRGLAITARHNILDALDLVGLRPATAASTYPNDPIRLYQVRYDGQYTIFAVRSIWSPENSDLALLEIYVDGHTGIKPNEWQMPVLSLFPPYVGASITAMGYRASNLRVQLSPGGDTKHIELSDKPMLAIGTVRTQYPIRRDAVLCPFPCFELDVRCHGGLSGGPVVEHHSGSVCGVVSTSLEDGSETPATASFASTLWPILHAPLSRGRYARLEDINDPILLDLALSGGGINLRNAHLLDPAHFPGRETALRRAARKGASVLDRLRGRRV